MLESRVEKISFYDPFSDFSKKEIKLEVRKDPITGDSSRILDVKFKPPELDVDEWVKGTEKNCPFCLKNVEKMTSKFTEDLIPEGRLRLGDLLCFPNVVSYSKYSSVVVATPYHFKKAHEIEEDILKDAFSLALMYLKRVEKQDKNVRFSSINWNFLYPAGASIVHPHLQTMADTYPSSKMEKILKNAFDSFLSGSHLFGDYIDYELKRDERFLVERDGVFSFISFSPIGAVPDFTFIFKEIGDIDGFQNKLEAFVSILKGIFSYMHSENLLSFNLAVYLSHESLPFYWIYARLTPRLFPRPVKNSDVNFVKMMQDECWVLIRPERIKSKVVSSLT